MYFFFCLLIFTSHSCSSYYIFRFFPQLGGLKNFSFNFFCVFHSPFFFFLWRMKFLHNHSISGDELSKHTDKTPLRPPFYIHECLNKNVSAATALTVRLIFCWQFHYWEEQDHFTWNIQEKKKPLKLSLLEFELGSHTKSSRPRASWSATCGTPQNISDSCLIVVCG